MINCVRLGEFSSHYLLFKQFFRNSIKNKNYILKFTNIVLYINMPTPTLIYEYSLTILHTFFPKSLLKICRNMVSIHLQNKVNKCSKV